MMKNYLKSALRNLWKAKTTSIINLTCLTVGTTTVALILLWVQNELSYDNYHPDSKQIFRATMHNSDNNTSEYSSLLLADAAKQTIPAVEKTARLFTASFYSPGFILNGERVKEKNYAYVDEGWFTMFQHDVLEGNTTAFGKKTYSLILTKSAAKRYFGNNPAVGQFIQVDSISYEVQAVIKDNPTNSSFQFDIWLPNVAYLADPKNRQNEESWGSGNYLTFIQLRKNADVQMATRQLNGILNKNLPSAKSSVSLLSLSDLHFETTPGSSVSRGNKTTILFFIIMAVLILLTACSNYISLTTAKAGLRAKEVSVRKIIGAKRKHLFFQFIFDSLVISVIALVLTLVLVHSLLPTFNSITDKQFLLPLSSVALWKVLGLTLFATLLISSIYPAMLLSNFSPLAVFRGASILSSKKGYFFKSLIVIQFTFSIVLIISTVVIFRQLNLIQQSDKGYNRSQIFSVSLPIQYFWFNYTEEARINFLATFKQQLSSQPGIAEVSVGPFITDINTRTAGNIDWDGRDKAYHPVIASINTDADFHKIYNLQMDQGRWFQPNNIADEHSFILNETAVQEFHLRTPVQGQRFVYNNDTGKIIGVVKDFHYSGLRNKIAPLVIHNKPGRRFGFLIKTTPASIPQALEVTKDQWKKLIPTQPFSYSFMDEAFEALYRQDKKTSLLITVFAVIAIIISGLGLFGLAAFTVEQRVKEIGIRKVLGASITSIVNILSKDFFKLIIVSIILSCPIAWIAMHKWLQDFAYRVSINWWVFAVAGLAAVFIALITVSFQAIKAALANPVKSLRTE